MTNDEKELVAAEVAAHMKREFGVTVAEASPIDKGWLNVKWKMETDRGPFFIKYYHPERYKFQKHPERRNAIEKTLQLQDGLNATGIPCPRVYHQNGRYIQETPSGLLYTVLDWVEGHTVPAGSMNVNQMYELGIATGRMHKWLRSVPPLAKLAWTPDKEVYLREWQENWEKAQESGDTIVLEWLERSRQIVTSMDFRIFEACPTGWLHWDLWVDNILLRENGLAGIVDFDRMSMAYPEIDIARALLSGSLLGGSMQIETVQAFATGYREHSEVPRGMLSRAMKMLYLIESIWWLRTEIRAESELRGLLGRFVEEIHWIEDHWASLPEILDGV